MVGGRFASLVAAVERTQADEESTGAGNAVPSQFHSFMASEPPAAHL